MLLLVSGGHKRRMTWLDRALLVSFHWRAHPLLAALYTRARRAEPRLPADPQLRGLYHGAAAGIDTDAATTAASVGVPALAFPAHWRPQGPRGPVDMAAGPKRNARMLRGEHDEGQVPPPDALLAFLGANGTADMVAKARAVDLPVVSLTDPATAAELATCQRWTKDDAWMLRANPRGVAEAHATRPGIGPALFSGHWLKVGGEVVIPPWCEYIGRDAHGVPASPLLANPFPVRPVGKDAPGRVVVLVDGAWREMDHADALRPYHDHLARLFSARRGELEPLLLRIAAEGRPLICWCDSKKPCHGTIVAEAAMQVWAREAVTAARAAAVAAGTVAP